MVAGGTRVYLALSGSLLRSAHEARRLEPPLLAHAVTADLLAELGDTDQDEAEYLALNAAALDALGVLAPGDKLRRVVLAADVPEWSPAPGDAHGPSAVLVTSAVPWRRIASVHVDGPDAENAVREAVVALADDPDVVEEETRNALERCLDHDLGWFGVQEVQALLADLVLEPPGGRATIG